MKNIFSFWAGNTAGGECFEELVAPHMDRLYRLAFRFSGRRENAEDLVQELLVRLYPRVDELRAVEKLGPWLAKSLYHLFVDETRRESRSPVNLVDEAAHEVEAIACTSCGPEAQAGRDRWLAGLEQAVYQLNPDQRSLIALHDMEGYALPELSEMLDVPLGTLKSRLHRARARLRELLEEPAQAYLEK